MRFSSLSPALAHVEPIRTVEVQEAKAFKASFHQRNILLFRMNSSECNPTFKLMVIYVPASEIVVRDITPIYSCGIACYLG